MEFIVMDIKLVPAIESDITKLAIVNKHFREMLRLNMVLGMWSLSMVLSTYCALKLGSTKIFNSGNIFVQEVSALKMVHSEVKSIC